MHSHCAMSNEKKLEKEAKHAMCHRANTHGPQPYVALNNLHVVAGENFCREGVESKPEPVIPLCLLRLQTAQISHEAYPAAMHSFVSLLHLPVWGGGNLWYTVQQPSPLLPSSFWSIRSHLLRADLYARCISASYWVSVSTPRRSHSDD